ncbi:hypothetical protein SO802_011454 [Lithocarpus litseifolius]|uniref:SWIM-type domain-containing protein n=1 Tax=Lithocarpus litseifolius TaxID=425828 RepID=A0AAW2D2J3_9ROSI
MCCDLGANSTSRFHYLILGGNLEQGLRLINEDNDVVYMCEIHAAWPTDKITLYVEGGEEPLVVEQPFANEEVVNDDDVHEVPQNGDDVHEMHEGGNVDAEEPDFDWLEEGFDGPDFDDDVFGNVDDGPSTHDGVSGSAAAPHRPSEEDTVNAAPHRTTPANNDPPLEEAPTAANEPEFNVQTDMRKPVLQKGMKFPNSKEFDKNPNWKVAGVQHHVKQTFEVDISYSQVYRAKRKANDLITGDEQLQYGKLRDYAEMIRLNDKGSRVILQTEMEDENAQPKFKRMYIRYNAQKQFSDDIGNPEQLNLVFITDRQKGLIPALEMLFPTCEHIYCVKHIYNNFKVDHKGLELKDALWRCAGAITIREFERRMQELKDLDVKACEYLADINLAQWSNSNFSNRALCDCLANNLSESFNAMILEARDKPILAMLEWIRVRLMTKQYKKMKGIAKYTGQVCPNIKDKLEKLKHKSIPFSATPSGRFMYEVDNGRERHVVDLTRKACSCRIWDLTGLPCKHGISAIVKNLEKVEDYVHPCYLKETFVETYKGIIQPMPGQSEWVETNQPALVAPHVYKPPGRSPK